MIPEVAVVAATKALYWNPASNGAGKDAPETWTVCEAAAREVLEAAAPYMLEPFSRIADNLRSTSDSHRKMAEYDPTFIAHLEIARELGAAALNIRRVINE